MPLSPDDAPLKPKDNPDDADYLKEIQGNILKPHGRPYTRLVLFWFDSRLPDTTDFRRLFAEAVTTRDRHGFPLVTSAHSQWEAARKREERSGGDSHPFYSLAITLPGLERCCYEGTDLPIQPPTGSQRPGSQDGTRGFGVPMNQIAPMLDFPPAADMSEWDDAYKAGTGPHGVWLLAHEKITGPRSIVSMTVDITAFLGRHGIHTTVVEDGIKWTDSAGDVREPFGFRDAISMPEFFDDAAYRAMSPWVKIPRSQVIIGDGRPHARGSFLVLRKLEQNVQAFRTFERLLQDELDQSPVGAGHAAGAVLLGRHRDGSPLGEPTGPNGSFGPSQNDFAFEDRITRCPFHAHIRKVNPRVTKTTPDLNPTTSTAHQALFVRRSAVYDEKGLLPASGKLTDKEFATYLSKHGCEITGGVGLLFMGYMRNIDAQFVRMQLDWLPSQTFPGNSTFSGDPILRPLGAVNRPWFWKPIATKNGIELDFPSASAPQPIVVKGGAYFYVPSLSWLQAQWPPLKENYFQTVLKTLRRWFLFHG